MAHKAKQKRGVGRQFAALPMKEDGDQTLVLLVTSRDTGRWVLPKGWAEKNLSGRKLAAKEAYEEAGIKGQVIGGSIGSYTYDKHLPGGKSMECVVEVFPMRVTRLLDKWPEARQRKREWCSLAEAALRVDEAELVEMLLMLAAPAQDVMPGAAEGQGGPVTDRPALLGGP